jgi:hypothetical protein
MLKMLAHKQGNPWFCWTFQKECLHLFGSYQDTMTLTNGRYIIQEFRFR